MPRKTRAYLPGCPVHVIQRGNNRMRCFFGDRDYRLYKDCLAVGLERYGGELHAYCLMPNHVHLLVTPLSEDSISRIMQHVGRQYVLFINRNHQRSGTLWEGRHRSSMIDSERYLMACYRYIELNPVKAGMVANAEDYLWSSAGHHADGTPDTLITPHPLFLSLGANERECRQHYIELLQQPLTEEEEESIRSAVQRNLPTGREEFTRRLEAQLGRQLRPGRPGRPALERSEQG